jgi:DUF1365 family protein
MHSCIYEGTVTHRRHEPVVHQFQYRLFMVYLDLDELPSLVGQGGLIAGSKYAGRSFLRSDHLFNNSQSLQTEIREIVLQQSGTRPKGAIRLLTQLRYFGTYFSPLNLFYVYDEQDECVEYIVAEVSNTPWKERHCYVLWEGNGTRKTNELRFSHPKQFHVSPFMGMDLEYRWRLNDPDSRLSVQLSNFSDSKQLFSAGMELNRRELDRQQLRRMTFRYPLMSLQIIAAIYYQALKLWWKKCPSYSHPKKQSNQNSRATTPSESAMAMPIRTDSQLPDGNDCLTPAASVGETSCGDYRSLSQAN